MDLFRRHTEASLRRAARLVVNWHRRRTTGCLTRSSFAPPVPAFCHVEQDHNIDHQHFRERGLLARRRPPDLIRRRHADVLAERDRVTRLVTELPGRQRVALMLRFHADLPTCHRKGPRT